MLAYLPPNRTHDSLVHIVGVISWDIVDEVVYGNECEDKISCHDKAYENLQRSVNMIDLVGKPDSNTRDISVWVEGKVLRSLTIGNDNLFQRSTCGGEGALASESGRHEDDWNSELIAP